MEHRSSASQAIHRILWNLKFYFVFTKSRNLFMFSARSIRSKPIQKICWRSIVLLCSLLHIDLPSGLFLSDFPTETPYAPLLSPICPENFVLHSSSRIVFCDECKPWTSVGMPCSLLESSLTSSLFFITPFSKTLSLCFSFSVVDQLSHQYNVPGAVGYWTLNILCICSSQ
jgi:hypothetical protein